MKLVIGGILGALVVISIGVWFLVVEDYIPYEIVEKDTIHPCEKLMLEYVKADKDWRYYGTPSLPDSSLSEKSQRIASGALETQEKLREKSIEIGCYHEDGSLLGDWLTKEFREKILRMTKS